MLIEYCAAKKNRMVLIFIQENNSDVYRTINDTGI